MARVTRCESAFRPLLDPSHLPRPIDPIDWRTIDARRFGDRWPTKPENLLSRSLVSWPIDARRVCLARVIGFKDTNRPISLTNVRAPPTRAPTIREYYSQRGGTTVFRIFSNGDGLVRKGDAATLGWRVDFCWNFAGDFCDSRGLSGIGLRCFELLLDLLEVRRRGEWNFGSL